VAPRRRLPRWASLLRRRPVRSWPTVL
jgi:hypothetical protein